MKNKRSKNNKASTLVTVIIGLIVISLIVFLFVYYQKDKLPSDTEAVNATTAEETDTEDDLTNTDTETEDTVTTVTPEGSAEINTVNFNDSHTFSDGGSVKINLNIPQISVGKYGESVDKFNEYVDTKVDAIKNEYLVFINSQSESTPDTTDYFNLDYTVYRNSRGIISLLLKTVRYFGGAHESTYFEGVNFDLNTGELITLDKLFSVSEAEYTAFLKSYILNEMRKNPEKYFTTEEGALDSVFQPNQFVLTDTGINVFFQIYDIAPYVAGFQMFSIPDSALSDILRK